MEKKVTEMAATPNNSAKLMQIIEEAETVIQNTFTGKDSLYDRLVTVAQILSRAHEL